MMFEIIMDSIKCVYETAYSDSREIEFLRSVVIHYTAKTESNKLSGISEFTENNSRISRFLMDKKLKDPCSLRHPNLTNIAIAEYEKIIKKELANSWR